MLSRRTHSRPIRCCLAACAMLTLLAATAAAQAHSAVTSKIDPPALVESAINQARRMAYYRDRVDWAALKRDMLTAVRSARDSIDMLAAYDMLVAALRDGHSFVNVSAEDRKEYRRRTGAVANAAPPRRASTFVGRSAIEQRSVAVGSNGTANLVVIPAFSGGGVRGNAYAARLHAAVVKGARHCGQVLDLRGNTGGNQWPMMAGISPLLGNGPQGAEIGPGGERRHYAVLNPGRVSVAEGADAGLTLAEVAGATAAPDLKGQAVAVLIDGMTASSGAGVAISLHGRRNTRFFGERSHPTTSSNEGFVLADGTNIVVTTTLMADRDWKTFPGGISPDVTVAATAGRDAPLDAALLWLGNVPQCRRAG